MGRAGEAEAWEAPSLDVFAPSVLAAFEVERAVLHIACSELAGLEAPHTDVLSFVEVEKALVRRAASSSWMSRGTPSERAF